MSKLCTKVFIKIYAYIPLAANTLKVSITNPIAIRIDMIGNNYTQLQSCVAQNKHILKQIVCAISFLGK